MTRRRQVSAGYWSELDRCLLMLVHADRNVAAVRSAQACVEKRAVARRQEGDGESGLLKAVASEHDMHLSDAARDRRGEGARVDRAERVSRRVRVQEELG